jgi:hypothetical protein
MAQNIFMADPCCRLGPVISWSTRHATANARAVGPAWFDVGYDGQLISEYLLTACTPFRVDSSPRRAIVRTLHRGGGWSMSSFQTLHACLMDSLVDRCAATRRSSI